MLKSCPEDHTAAHTTEMMENLLQHRKTEGEQNKSTDGYKYLNLQYSSLFMGCDE